MVTSSDPDVEVLLVHVAEQAVELLDDQVKVDVLFTKTVVGSAERLIIGEGAAGVESPPPPPPPPQEAIKNVEKKTNSFFIDLCQINTYLKNIAQTY